MSKRKVTLKLTTQKDLVVRESEARTFGELKTELSDISFDGMRVVERSKKVTLQMDDAVLPATDFILFLVPEKVKSGQRIPKINVEKASYNELRSQISVLNKIKNANIPINGKVEELRSGLREYYTGKETPAELKAKLVEESTADNSSTVNKIIDCKLQIIEAIDTIIEAAKAPAKAEDYVIKTSMKDIEDEISKVKSSLAL